MIDWKLLTPTLMYFEDRYSIRFIIVEPQPEIEKL